MVMTKLSQCITQCRPVPHDGLQHNSQLQMLSLEEHALPQEEDLLIFSCYYLVNVSNLR